ncbi:MAG: type II toxin-antitoxin system VapC family toxin [Bacteroidota bacterium]|nr:type II toxin-antitoxin system VapC family toxin [Bacteroidota bacterium]
MDLKFLLDSNAVIDFLGGKYPTEGMNLVNSAVDDIPNFSIISKIEVLSYKASEIEYELLLSFCRDALILQLNEDIVQKTIALRIDYKLKTPDAIIAATALVYDMILITRNVSDFGKVQRLTIINPFEV